MLYQKLEKNGKFNFWENLRRFYLPDRQTHDFLLLHNTIIKIFKIYLLRGYIWKVALIFIKYSSEHIRECLELFFVIYS